MTQPVDVGEGRPERANKTRAGLAGAGGGTGLVVLAQACPEPWRHLLVYVAPSATVALASAAYYIEVQVTRYFQRRLVERLRRTLSAYLRSPDTSEQHKAELRKQLETVEQVITLQEIEHIEVIGSLPQLREPKVDRTTEATMTPSQEE